MKTYRELLEENEGTIEVLCDNIQDCEKRWTVISTGNIVTAVLLAVAGAICPTWGHVIMALLPVFGAALFVILAAEARKSRDFYVSQYQELLERAFQIRRELQLYVKIEEGDYWK